MGIGPDQRVLQEMAPVEIRRSHSQTDFLVNFGGGFIGPVFSWKSKEQNTLHKPAAQLKSEFGGFAAHVDLRKVLPNDSQILSIQSDQVKLLCGNTSKTGHPKTWSMQLRVVKNGHLRS